MSSALFEHDTSIALVWNRGSCFMLGNVSDFTLCVFFLFHVVVLAGLFVLRCLLFPFIWYLIRWVCVGINLSRVHTQKQTQSDLKIRLWWQTHEEPSVTGTTSTASNRQSLWCIKAQEAPPPSVVRPLTLTSALNRTDTGSGQAAELTRTLCRGQRSAASGRVTAL